jgi:hypothetical protein
VHKLVPESVRCAACLFTDGVRDRHWHVCADGFVVVHGVFCKVLSVEFNHLVHFVTTMRQGGLLLNRLDVLISAVWRARGSEK